MGRRRDCGDEEGRGSSVTRHKFHLAIAVAAAVDELLLPLHRSLRHGEDVVGLGEEIADFCLPSHIWSRFGAP